jgi:hypothetical protein
VLVAGTIATIANHDDAFLVIGDWFPFVLYLTLCAEPMRRVVRDQRVSWPTAVVYLGTSVFGTAGLLCLPVSYYGSDGYVRVAAIARVVGIDRFTSAAASVPWSTASWLFTLTALAGAVTLWGLIARLARTSRGQAIEHSAGDATLATWATLDAPLGTSVTRPAPERRRSRSSRVDQDD